MNKEMLRNIIRFSWEFIFGVFSKNLACNESQSQIIKEIENMLIMGKASGMVNLDIISNAFINSIINMSGLNLSLYNKLDSKNILVLQTLFSFIQKNGKYINSSWYSIFCITSRINQLKKCKPNFMYKVLEIKNIDIKNFAKNYEYNNDLVESINIDQLYASTKEFSLEILTNFIKDLIKIIDDEMNLFKTGICGERFLSLNKLIYVLAINKERLKNQENFKIYEIVKQYFDKLINENPKDDILINKIKDASKKIDEKEI